MKPLEGRKVVTAQEMARIEKCAFAEGASELSYMQQAGESIAHRAQNFVLCHKLPKVVTLLTGKGNNAGDAYAAGAFLLKQGFQINALPIYPLEVCSPLCKKMQKEFIKLGGKTLKKLPSEGILLDGLVGTGFTGKAEGNLAKAIDLANHSDLPILAIDIPSGLNGNTGVVQTLAIRATETFYLELPKIGFFLSQGWNHVGILRHASFGLESKYHEKAHASAYLFNESSVSFPPILRTRHKYQAGYVLAFAGSPSMPGAALLSATAALKSGAGIVRLFHPPKMQTQLSFSPFELIKEEWNGKKLEPIQSQVPRAKAFLIGPGLGRTKQVMSQIQLLLTKIALPMVIDADALYFLAKKNCKLPAHSILTPHHGEMDLLLNSTTTPEACQKYVETKNTTLVLKGAPTFLFHPQTVPLIITRGDPGMATAGSGDVLTGIIASMLAQGLPPRHAAALATYLHGLAGELTAKDRTSYCLTASDLIDFLPDAFFAAQDAPHSGC